MNTNVDFIINWWVLIGGTVAVFVLGAIWYSVIFGKAWSRIMGFDPSKVTKEEMQKLQKSMSKFYALELLMTFLTSWVLYSNIKFLGLITFAQAAWYAFFMWLGFMMPMLVSSVIWGNTDKKHWCSQIMISISYRLIAVLGLAWLFTCF